MKSMEFVQIEGLPNTKVYEGMNYNVIKFYNTEIVKFTPHFIALNTGGYDRKVTIKRLNQISELYELSYHVFNENGLKVRYFNQVIPFVDGMAFDRPQ